MILGLTLMVGGGDFFQMAISPHKRGLEVPDIGIVAIGTLGT